INYLDKFDEKADEGFFIGYFVVSKAMRVFSTMIVEETLNIRFLENAPNVKGNGPDWLFDIDSLTISMNYVTVVAGFQTNGLLQQARQTEHINSTNSFNTISSPVNTAGPSFVNATLPLPINVAGTPASTNAFEEHPFERFSPFKNAFSLPYVPIVTPINDTKIFGNAYDDEVMEEEVDMNNVVSSYTILDAPLTKFLKDHLKDQEIGSIETPVQTRQMTKINKEYARIEAIRLFLAYVSFKDFLVYQMDIKSDFLYEKIEEEDAEAQDVDVYLYGSMIGSLMYLTASRPDITFAVCACVRFQVTPKTSYLHVVKRIFRYLKGQPKLGLWYPRDSPLDLEAYSDSDYAKASLDKKSTTGDETVYKEWKDKIKRAVTTASSLEAEHESGNINRTQFMATLNEPLPHVIGSGSGPRRSKDCQAKDIANLKKRVKKLENRRKSRPEGLKRLKKKRSIEDINQDAEIALVDEAHGRMHDAYMFGVDDLEGNEVIVDVREKFVEKEVSTADPVTTAGEVVIAASVEDSAAPTTTTTADVDDELTLAKTLITIKAAKPKDKSKAKIIEPEKPLKKKDQIALDEEV
nr:hypothetical protein [Tanacetum cinerariifolium]